MNVNTATGTVVRTYDITLPATCDSSHLVPLVFVFHGDGGNGNDMYAGFPIEAAASAAGGTAIFVYPDGTDNNIDPGGAARAWDLYHDPGYFPYPYTPGQSVPAMNDEASGNADIDFFDTMVESFEKEYCVDTSKIWITGMSSGGYLSEQFARWRPTVVKATGPQSGGMPFGNPDGDTGGSDGSDFQPPNYCIGLTGAVQRVEIREYREPYGDEVRGQRFRDQFVGKTANDAMIAGKDIDIISGATYSSKAMALGVKRGALVLQAALKSGL